MRNLLLLGLLMVLIQSCNDKEEIKQVKKKLDSTSIQLLQDIPPSQSGINFQNNITQTEQLNSITFQEMLIGAGVGILDANNDGLQDIYFASNMQDDKLYINKGDFKFEDKSKASGINIKNWSTGVAIVDINNDGYDDIYVCKFMYDDPSRRANVFYINQRNGTFADKAAEMGVDDKGYTIMANFFDFDRDGDLDLYLANQPPNSLQLKEQLKGKIDYKYTDKLYRNDGGKFSDVTLASGVQNYSYSLSATTLDYNKDGWPDLYIACDYDEADLFYKNNGNGTFTNVANKSLKHMSNFSMGADIADINNDGHEDIYVADMVAEDNFRQKTNMSGMNPQRFFALAKAGYHYQYMFNALQLNNGDNSFSEIAQLSGVSNTDWSWSPLFIDLDQDGYKDLLVTNGLMREMRNKDFEKWRTDFFKQKLEDAKKTASKQLYINPLEIVNKAPSIKIANYAFKNNGDLSFTNQNSKWGFEKKTWSQGSAYADFDNDGDLDLVINNMNMVADLYKNTANENNLNNYINIQLEGPQLNKSGINATIEVTSGGMTQSYEMTPTRGYMSSSQRIAHFGIGSETTVDKIVVKWSDNKMNIQQEVKANQNVVINHKDANSTTKRGLYPDALFKANNNISHTHIENEFDDYKAQILLPYKTSTLGPIIAHGDVNNDGHEDVYVGSSAGQLPALLLNDGVGGLKVHSNSGLKELKYEDGGAAFLDIDNDGDQDLYVSSGGNEFSPNSSNYQDRLYINNGKGTFNKSQLLPKINISSSIVLPLDYDGDGDLDLFIGGRQIPGQYGRVPESYIITNNKGKYEKLTGKESNIIKDLGMVTDAKLADLNRDGKKELIVIGEWMRVEVIALDKGLSKVTEQYGLSNTKGWWNTLEIADIDQDGDQDIIVGNLGYNIKYKASPSEPFKVYVDDFDKNGTNDVYLGYYENGQCYPVRGKQCSTEQMPFVSEKFPNYKDFGIATIDNVLEGHISETTTVQEAQTFATTLFLNKGQKFESNPLPTAAQISPTYGIAIDDFDGDGRNDIFLAGNMYQREVETTRSDAGKGCLVSIDSNGNMTTRRGHKIGLSADKDVRAVSIINSGNKKLLLIANNNDKMQFFNY